MLSHLQFRDDGSRAYSAPMQPPRLPSLRMPLPPQQQQQPHDHFHHQEQQHYYPQPNHHFHHQHPYQSPAHSLPSLPMRTTSPMSDVSSPSGASSHKCSLAFILSEPAQDAKVSSLPLQRANSDASTGVSSDADSLDNDPLDHPHSLKHKRRGGSGSPSGVGSKSKYCIVEGCTSRAKHARKCWRHGGSVKCKVQDCINRAKSRGVCWSHGGGTTCSHTNCGTIAVSHGFCWAHGGGKRCEVGGCSRPAYERTQNLCSTHFKQQKAAAKATVTAVSH